MSILVTGGTGALGYHILSSLVGTTHDLYSFSDEQPQPWQKVEGVEYLNGDLLNFKHMQDVIQFVQPTHIYHLASQSSVGLSYKKPYETLNINLLGTQNLLEAVRQNCPKAKVMLLSSSEIYGRTDHQLTYLHKESDAPNPLTPYATSKACMELLGNQFKNAYGLHVVFARPFHFTGPHHSRRFVIPSITYQLVKIKYYGAEPTIYSGSLDISRDVIDVRDVARGMIQLLNQSEPGEAYNLCCGKSYTFRELTEMLVDIAEVSVDFRFDPGYERSNDIPLLIGDPTKAMNMGWKPMISVEDSLTDLFNEMVLRRRTELKLGMGQDLRL
ncbi:GDP-4-dehydro-6-deoxy-D-mannose reductase [Fibrobacter sp. UWB15]|uniref:GDP-mannose 4,6-dehydratase n=1 Tax=unclassified Fibrobacter TaxID=2634177 RepID=UPI0009165C01|nr:MULTISPECIES: GDP-mannose 4,6-dehydratase [unclassified Fibrobacter]PWJ67230.1 GDP-4-dehydro-6-deoxy-D-mannose reductase [Fibrobacter sp. UWB6]SHF61812.1 GDP-4-dehydro-6-deoxy-D-mannose reductase [Fibrobacter sp. UWB8]SMG08303.1 GDP-4-dehydro-6-deoxy-D-mannose reductase [Fibrobacter sp. UWB15]